MRLRFEIGSNTSVSENDNVLHIAIFSTSAALHLRGERENVASQDAETTAIVSVSLQASVPGYVKPIPTNILFFSHPSEFGVSKWLIPPSFALIFSAMFIKYCVWRSLSSMLEIKVHNDLTTNNDFEEPPECHVDVQVPAPDQSRSLLPTSTSSVSPTLNRASQVNRTNGCEETDDYSDLRVSLDPMSSLAWK